MEQIHFYKLDFRSTETEPQIFENVYLYCVTHFNTGGHALNIIKKGKSQQSYEAALPFTSWFKILFQTDQ